MTACLGLFGGELFNCDAGVVDQHGDRAERGFRGIERPCDSRRIRHVHLDRRCAAASGLDLRLQALQLVGLARRQHHRGTVA